MERDDVWRPILDGRDRQRAEEALAAITADILALDADWNGTTGEVTPSGLNGGRAGVAVFLAYHARVTGRIEEIDRAVDLLERSIQESMRSAPGLSFSDGLTGVAWAVTHLSGDLNLAQEGDPVAAVDEAVAELLADEGWEVADELLYGLSGYGIWALERLPAPVPLTVLELIVARLVRSVEVVDTGVTWRTPPEWLSPEARDAYPTGRVDLGVAHGVPGVLGFLARAVAAGIGGAAAGQILDKAVAYLLEQRADGFGGTTLPPYLGFDLRSGSARTAWCYGDLGVAAALLAAGRHAGRTDWEGTAVAMATSAADRDSSEMRLLGTGICHGTAGAAHIFQRLHQATGDPDLREAARRWFRRTLDDRRPGHGVGGFGRYRATPGGVLQWGGDPALIDGAAGVGLVLLSGLEPVAPEWDRAFLMAPPGER